MVASIALVALVLGSTQSLAQTFEPNFGGKYLYYTNVAQTMRAGKAGIEVPPSKFLLTSGNIGLARIYSQGGGIAIQSDGLMQIGFAKTTGSGGGVSDCGHRVQMTHFTEWRYVNSDFHCRWIDEVPYGSYNYIVWRRPTEVCGHTQCWASFLAGQLQASADVGYDGANYLGAGGEINGPAAYGSNYVEGCWACGGLELWQRSQFAGGGGQWVEITSSSHVNDDSEWQIDPLPGPFRITHPFG